MKVDIELITTKEVAQMCGVCIYTIYRWIDKDAMPPPLRLGNPIKPRLRWNRSEIYLWLKCKPAKDDEWPSRGR